MLIAILTAIWAVVLSMVIVAVQSPLTWCIAIPAAATMLFGTAAHHGFFE